jgi:hypothetical protein
MEYQAAVTARALGAEVEIPDPDEARARFDALLVQEPKAKDAKRMTLEAALGIGGRR